MAAAGAGWPGCSAGCPPGSVVPCAVARSLIVLKSAAEVVPTSVPFFAASRFAIVSNSC